MFTKTLNAAIAAVILVYASPAIAGEITLHTVDEITSKSAKIGDAVPFTVEGCASCAATGEVTFVEKRGNRARDGRLIIEVVDVDGVPATGRLEVRGKNVVSDVAAAGAFGLAGLLVKGSHAVIDAGTAVVADVEGVE